MDENINVPTQNEIEEPAASAEVQAPEITEAPKPKRKPRKKKAEVQEQTENDNPEQEAVADTTVSEAEELSPAEPTPSEPEIAGQQAHEATDEADTDENVAEDDDADSDGADEVDIVYADEPDGEPENRETDVIADLQDDDGAIGVTIRPAATTDGEEPAEHVSAEDEADEAVEAEGLTEEEPEDEAENVREYMDVEHFSDYRAATELEPEELTTEEEYEDAEAETVFGFEEGEPHEYENLTILDEPEEEPERPIKKVREESPDEEKYNPDKPRKVDLRFDLLELFVFTLVAIMILTTFAFKHSKVEGSSMNTTLFDGDHLIISDLFYEPERYDIIVCEDYSTGLRKPIVKRVIATEGEHVLVKSLNEVYVNGVLIENDFVWIDGAERADFQLMYPIELTVPEGEVFVMGDHRNDSLDSRQLGTIDEDSILGKVLIRFYPFDSFGAVE
ncbi:MAG: signal peptidase I [Clostridia bacterium]|nr:signal peptidase I [Clostridia bacterium]